MTDAKSPRPALDDIVEAIERIRAQTEGISLAAFESDWERRWLVERGAAMRDIPEPLIAEHRSPTAAISGFRNALAHTYEGIVDERLILTIHEDLPNLDRRLAAIQATLSEVENGPRGHGARERPRFSWPAKCSSGVQRHRNFVPAKA